MDSDLNVKEFVALTPETINTLLDSRRRPDTEATRGHESRRATRWPFPGQVQIWLENAAGEEMQIFGTCHNLNEHGIGLSCDQPLPIGAQLPVAIHQPEATYHGDAVVRHCTLGPEGYFIGMEFAAAAID